MSTATKTNDVGSLLFWWRVRLADSNHAWCSPANLTAAQAMASASERYGQPAVSARQLLPES